MISFTKKITSLTFVLFAFCFILANACKNSKKRTVTPAFYHWKNTLDLSKKESVFLSNLNIQKIYLRFFDIDWKNNKAIPISILETKTKLPDSIQIIPTVFITNRTMINIKEETIPKLGEQIFQKINALEKQFSENRISEIQFDCDWSPKSKKNYFSLLKVLKSKFTLQNKAISSTIRLHQVKYFKTTGVPPVDRGILMFYNMDKIDKPKTANSIINLALAKQYFKNFDNYPLKLDIALPTFKWGIVFQDDKLVKIINNLDISDLQDKTRFNKIEENRFELVKSTYLKGYYLYQKDQIRLERVDIKDLQKAADLLSDLIPNKDLNIVFYHLDSIQITDYPYEVLKDIYSRFY